MESQKEYKKQLYLSVLELAAGLPSFILLLISYFGTKTTLVFMDAIDSGGNVIRNALVLFISVFLVKDQRFSYNYGIGKIEASSTIVCDLIMIFSLLVSIGMAIHDFLTPHAPGEFLIYVVLLKVLYVFADLFMTWREWKLMKTSGSLIFKTKFAAGVKNSLFDIITLTALLLMQVFSNARWTWYISPVVSIVLGVYLIYQTIGRVRTSLKILLDKTADEKDQMLIMQTLSKFFSSYNDFRQVRSRYNGEVLCVELDLGFNGDTTYSQLQELADRVSDDLSKNIPKCVVSLTIPARPASSQQAE